MGLTALQLVQSAAYETNTPAPSALVGATDSYTLQQLNLFYATGRELRQARCWPQLKRQHMVFLTPGRERYPLPRDFYAALPATHWDQGNKWQMQGPLSDGNWNYRLYGYVTIENRKAFRVFGPDINPNDGQGQLQINPVPGDAQFGVPLTFEYLSKSWLLPPSWSSGGSVSASAYVNSCGNIYSHSVGTTCGTVPPNAANGVGRDGAVFWLYVLPPAWVTATGYNAGDYVTNGGNTYRATTAGVSTGTGPSGTSDEITDGTVVWEYITITTWAPYTEYGVGDHVTLSGNLYRCVTVNVQGNNTAKSGATGPTWGTNVVTDGLLNWTYVSTAYESILSDSDLCLFDDELMICGLKWRFLRARGLQYEDQLNEYDTMKRSAVSRWNAGMRLSMGGGGLFPGGLAPSIAEGNWSF